MKKNYNYDFASLKSNKINKKFVLKNQFPFCQILDEKTFICFKRSTGKIELTTNDGKINVWACDTHKDKKIEGEALYKRQKLCGEGILNKIFELAAAPSSTNSTSSLGGPSDTPLPTNSTTNNQTNTGLSGDLFGVGPTIITTSFYTPAKQIWLTTNEGKGLEIKGTFTRRNGAIVMEMRFQNNATQAISDFDIQLDENRCGLAPAVTLNIPIPIQPNNGYDVILPLNNLGPVQKMQPFTNLHVGIGSCIGGSIRISYFSCVIPMHVFCIEIGAEEKREFLDTWSKITSQNEVQYQLNIGRNTIESLQNKLQSNNIFTIGHRNVHGIDLLYQIFKLVNNIWVLTELEKKSGIQEAIISIKCSLSSSLLDVAQPVKEMYELLINI